MRFPLTLSHVHAPPHPGPGTLREVLHSQPFRDKLYVAAVVALVLATVALAAGYAIHQWPHWRQGQVGGIDATILPLPDDTGTPEPAAPGAGIDRGPLILTSMLVEAVIFVGLGLYLRREMNRKP